MDTIDVCPIPLLLLALIEARKYRWQKSIAKNQDAGEDSICEWFRLYWRPWYRQHWVDHLKGCHYYEGFSADEFNITSTETEDRALVQTIVEHLTEEGNDGENLGIIFWANEIRTDMHKVIEFLRKIHINDKRFAWDAESLKIVCFALREADQYKWIESQKAGCDLGEAAIYEWFKLYWNEWKNKNFPHFFNKAC
jgi:hypothetical protein